MSRSLLVTTALQDSEGFGAVEKKRYHCYQCRAAVSLEVCKVTGSAAQMAQEKAVEAARHPQGLMDQSRDFAWRKPGWASMR